MFLEMASSWDARTAYPRLRYTTTLHWSARASLCPLDCQGQPELYSPWESPVHEILLGPLPGNLVPCLCVDSTECFQTQDLFGMGGIQGWLFSKTKNH